MASLSSCGFFCSSVIGSISGWLSLLSAKAAGADIREAEIRCWAGTCEGKRMEYVISLPRGGGGGGALGYLGGCIRSLSKLKNTPKALISGQKSTLILIKR